MGKAPAASGPVDALVGCVGLDGTRRSAPAVYALAGGVAAKLALPADKPTPQVLSPLGFRSSLFASPIFVWRWMQCSQLEWSNALTEVLAGDLVGASSDADVPLVEPVALAPMRSQNGKVSRPQSYGLFVLLLYSTR